MELEDGEEGVERGYDRDGKKAERGEMRRCDEQVTAAKERTVSEDSSCSDFTSSAPMRQVEEKIRFAVSQSLLYDLRQLCLQCVGCSKEARLVSAV